MPLKITDKKDYILVTPPNGINFWEIIMGIGKLIKTQEFLEKSDIWVFHKGAVDITYPDIQKIKDFGTAHYPGNVDGQKTAIVVETGFQRGLAESYISVGEKHPRKIRVFSEFRDAEDWITK